VILPGRQDRGLVVFHVLPSISYGTRMAVSFALMALGLAAQAVTGAVWPWLLLLAAGNLLLLVRGYDNRVDAGKYDPAAEWGRVDIRRLDDLARLDREMRAWDRSALDVTNPAGGALFVLVAGTMGVAAVWVGSVARILVIDAMILMLPHWLTGVRSILVKPRLMVRVDFMKSLLLRCEESLGEHTVNLLMMFRGSATKIPEDIKIRVDIRGRREGFLGLYGQIVINEVQGSSYPYFYVVLVARRGFGLIEFEETYTPLQGMVSEAKTEGEVEVLVIRQTTTKTSGYHTSVGKAAGILLEGLDVAGKVAVDTAARRQPA